MATDHDQSRDTTKGPDEKGSDSAAEDRRRAARLATFVAVPVTIVAAIGAFALVNSTHQPADSDADHSGKGSGKTVSIDAPVLADADFKACRALVTKVPQKLTGLDRRLVDGKHSAAEVAAAWGDPAVRMRCGVEEVTVPKSGEVYRLGAVCWYADANKHRTIWTTVDREQPVELTVPATHKQPGQLAQALSKPVAKKIEPIKDIPSGCSGK